MDIVEAVYRISAAFPKTEVYGLTSQLRRAAISMPSNIAEGHTRSTTKEYLYYISMAEGSLAEVETQLELAARLKFVTAEQLAPVQEECVYLGRQLSQLRSALQRRLRPTP
jgi:four helix bundle protein